MFCGCGGFSEGFRQAGHEIVLAIDFWEHALKSHEMNHTETEHWLEDIRNVDKLPKCDIIIGSPPCQNFSDANINKDFEKGLELVREFERIVKINKPKYWMFENVKPLAKIYKNACVLDSFDYGLDQHRRRAFVCNFSYFRVGGIVKGKLTKEYCYSGALKENKNPGAINHVCKSGTVTTKRIRDMETNEYINMEEVKKLMGFPIDYKLYGGVSIQQKQLGNAVCPPIARDFGEYLNNHVLQKHI